MHTPFTLKIKIKIIIIIITIITIIALPSDNSNLGYTMVFIKNKYKSDPDLV